MLGFWKILRTYLVDNPYETAVVKCHCSSKIEFSLLMKFRRPLFSEVLSKNLLKRMLFAFEIYVHFGLRRWI